MTWNPADYGGLNEITIPSDMVWKPMIILTSAVGEIVPIGIDANWLPVRFHFSGIAAWSPGESISSNCPMNVKYFPFDTQVCEFMFIPWGFKPNEVVIRKQNDVVQNDLFSENGQWEFLESEIKTDTQPGYSSITAHIRLQRRSAFFLVNFVFPVVFITLLNLLVFCLPVESGERMSFTVTVLLAVAVFMTIVAANLPKNSKDSALIGYFFLLNMAQDALIVIETAISIIAFYKTGEVPRPLNVF
ncbi:neuronal acetylcholine receptor subunit alpha-6-like [Mya arenaria]|uniref:neuronal acetylcholine receptor subunit alpha-6-like n=1 Tax=Mya arenaria TaxID=6604 RepID=UPI0022E6E953|nr:neuronal acetylcholine receptor subunit alpha-6-like [Mya arenaria]